MCYCRRGWEDVTFSSLRKTSRRTKENISGMVLFKGMKFARDVTQKNMVADPVEDGDIHYFSKDS